MENYKRESNITIIINALREIIQIFAGPFLTAYFIKTSSESIIDISLYNIFSYIVLAIGALLIGYIIKNNFKMATFRIGVIINFIYILSIAILKEKVINYLWVLSILYGLSSSMYHMPFNLFVTNKIKDEDRISYQAKDSIALAIINIAVPILLGSIITITNYVLTAVIILFVSLLQIVFSFMLKPIDETKEKFSLKQTMQKVKSNKNVKGIILVEYITGLSINASALATIINILIYQSFYTDLNMGIITSVAYSLQILSAFVYGKYFKQKSDKNIIILSTIAPIFALFLFLFIPNRAVLVFYNICYAVFINLLSMMRVVRLYNISNSKIIGKESQAEFWIIREISLNLGRVTSYALLLLVGIINSQTLLGFVMIILTLFIYLIGIILRKIDVS